MYSKKAHASCFYATLGVVLAGALWALPAVADSQARIVRLSDVQGSVQIDKNSGLGFESAFANLPITQGTQLRAGDNGRAEIEFEDGSTLRVAPNTTVRFSTLGVTDAGKHVSEVALEQGRVYVNWLGKGGDEFALNFSQENVKLTEPAHIRVAVSSSQAEVASFKNDIEVTGPAGAVKVDKKKMISFDLNDNGKSTEAKNIKEDPYDQWDQQAAEYHDQYSKNNSTPYGYGASDLSYYGSYNNVVGYGTLWQPYFSGLGWSPFMDGAWSWYPGYGYLWASAYPWGWLPYYYGNWIYAPGYGWGWQPGGWNAWNGGLHYVGASPAFRAPVAPTGTVNTAVVGRGGSTLAGAVATVVTKGSAGLGIARGSFDNLGHLNTQLAKAKTGSVQLHPAAQFAASSARTNGFGFGEMHGMPAEAAGRGASMGAGAGHAAGGGGGGGHAH
jgi:hypothetical protein